MWADWYTGTQSGTVYYTTNDGYLYTGLYGPFSSNDTTLSFSGRANDNYGNWTPINFSITVTNCIE